MALFKSFSNITERLTAYVCTSLISAHGPYFIGRYYLYKGYYLLVLYTSLPTLSTSAYTPL
jgi:hypothetical protein